jgi:hypothetical protein
MAPAAMPQDKEWAAALVLHHERVAFTFAFPRPCVQVQYNPMHIIDYVHENGSIFFHGAVSDLDGVPKSTWTWEENGGTVTQEQPIEQGTFCFLWNGIANLDVFHRSRVRDPDRKLDWVSFHVISITFQKATKLTKACFLVPGDEAI